MDAADNSTPDLPESDSDDGKFTMEVVKSILEKLPAEVTDEQRRKIIVSLLQEYGDIPGEHSTWAAHV